MPDRISTDYTLELAEEHIANANGNIDRLNEVHVFNQTDVTPNSAAGQVQTYADATSNLLSVVTPAGQSSDIPWTTQATQPGTVVTAASLTVLATATIPANDMVVGAVYELEAWGSGTQASGARQTLQFAARIGGTDDSTFTFGTTNWSAVSVGFRWYAKARLIVLSLGAGGTADTSIHAETTEVSGNIAAGNNNVGVGFQCNAGSHVTVDTTGNRNFVISAAWGATTGSPTMTNREQIFRRIA